MFLCSCPSSIPFSSIGVTIRPGTSKLNAGSIYGVLELNALLYELACSVFDGLINSNISLISGN